MKSIVAKAAGVAAFVGLWQLLSSTGVISSLTAPSPWRTAVELRSLVVTDAFWDAVAETSKHWSIGLGLSCAVAIPAGLLLGASELVYRGCRFTIDFVRTVPPVTVLPLALLLYGSTTKMVVMLIMMGAIWPMLLQTMYGVQQIDPLAREMARTYRLRWRDRVVALVLPSAAPFVATGIRIAATFSLLFAIGSEFIGGAPGIGSAITFASANGLIPEMYAYIVCTAFLGLALNLALVRVERHVLSWHVAHRPLVPA